MTRLLETCSVSPPESLVEAHSLPLTFFDLPWLPFHPIRRLHFYRLPFPREHFLESLLVIPKLKHSLSLTLHHYFPLAGTLAFPVDTNEHPLLRYAPGDSVSLTVFESDANFDNLVGNHARDSDQFYDFIPQHPPVYEESGWKLLPLLAVQLTIFPGRGMCIGLSNHHIAGDGASIIGFIKFWADLCKNRGENEAKPSFPVFDRSLVNEPPGAYSFYWNLLKQIPIQSFPLPLPTNRVRATFILLQPEIDKIKNLLKTRKPDLLHVSSFVVTAAYVWTCLAKALVCNEVADDFYFMFAIDVRSRLNPPLPGNYFGNSLAYGLAKTRDQDLIGDEGFFVAAEAIAMEIQNKVHDKENMLADMENWLAEVNVVMQKQIFSVSGSARVDLYDMDFGWGKMRKVEMLSIEEDKYAMSLCKSRESKGGLEAGMSLPKDEMDAFSAAFAEGLFLINS